MNLIKGVIVFVLKHVLYILDKDHRTKNNISDDVKKFTHTSNVNFKSDFGNVLNVVRTVPYEMWEIKTITKKLKCADKHILFYNCNGTTKEIYASDIVVGMLLETDNGLERVTSIRNMNCRVHCYCVEVDDEQHRYYTDGIMSHNTTCAAAYILWFTTFRSTKTVLIAANKLAQAVEILDRIKFSYELLPKWLKAGTLKFNERMIKFDNKSRIICRATTKDSGRGLSIALLYVDEFGIIAPNLSREFYTAIKPTLATGGKMIITSTPMSDEDQFADIWFGSQNRFDEQGEKIPNGEGKNGFYGMKYIWSDHPDRGEKWAKEWRASMDIRKFRQEFECEFISSDETLIASDFLTDVMKYKNDIFKIGGTRWFKEPVANHIYGLTLDPSMGTGGDPAAIQVFDLTAMEQVAEWEDNRTPTEKQIGVINDILSYIYQTLSEDPKQKGEPDLYWTFENNSCGEGIVVALRLIGEDRIPATLLSEKGKRTGMWTGPKNKLAACSIFKRMVEKKRMTIYSQPLISQLKGFVYSAGTYKAKPGMRDDLVMAAIIMIRLYEIVTKWEDNVADEGDILEDEDDFIQPMPMAML